MEEKKLVTAYIVKRFEDGTIAVEDAGMEGTETLTDELMYKDIEEVAKVVANKRVENAAYYGAYRFYMDLQARQQAEMAAQAAAAEEKEAAE